MREVAIVSTARTGLAKSFRGGFNNTNGVRMSAPTLKAAIERAGIDPAEVDDVIWGCGNPEGATGMNVARTAAIAAGCPVTTSGTTINRFCSSGLQAIATAAGRIMTDGVDVMAAGGVESISMVQPNANRHGVVDAALFEQLPGLYMPMIETADIVAARYNVSREYQDEYALLSQQRTAAAQAAGKFDDEIVPVTTTMLVMDKESGETSEQEVTVDRDDCNRPNTTLEGLAALQPVRGEDQFITAGNASQLSDGASAQILMERSVAEQRGLDVLGVFRGFAVGGCAPDEMGIGPVYAVPKLLKQAGLTVDDIDLWELNEAFASQCLYSADTLGIDKEKLNVNGGSIAIGHPFGMTGSRLAGHLLIEGRRRGARYGLTRHWPLPSPPARRRSARFPRRARTSNWLRKPSTACRAACFATPTPPCASCTPMPGTASAISPTWATKATC
jgi:acetyl-CoA C-acetyltransferase